MNNLPLQKGSDTAFARFRYISLAIPGGVIDGNEIYNGGNSGETYTGKLIIIVNSLTRSQAEYTTMAFSPVPGALVIGDTMAGVDGDVSGISLQSALRTNISGLGVYYPDNTEAQPVG